MSSEFQDVVARVCGMKEFVADRIGVAGWDDEQVAILREEGPDEELEGEADDDEEIENELFLTRSVTVVEAVTPLLDSDRQSPVLEALQVCMEKLNEFSRVYRLANHVPMVPLSYETLPYGGVVWGTRDPFVDGWNSELEILMFPDRMPQKTEHPELDEERLERFVSYWEYWSRNPLVFYSERSLEARLALDNVGDYASCVLQCHIAMEVLFDALLKLLLWEEGMEPSVAARDVFALGLHKRVRSQFPPRLGGNWNTKARGPVGSWAQTLVPLRNRIVHAGYRPSRDEALEALRILSDVDEFFRVRLVASRNRYMRTTLMSIGSPGLKRHNAWSGRIREFAEKADEEPSWTRSFDDWRQRLEVERAKAPESDGGRVREGWRISGRWWKDLLGRKR